MPQPHGLGKGLSSLIPEKKTPMVKGDAPASSPPAPLAKKAPLGATISNTPPSTKGVSSAKPLVGSPFAVGTHPLKDIPLPEEGVEAAPLKAVEPLVSPSVPAPRTPEPKASGSGDEAATLEGALRVPTGDIVSNPHQPRVHFNEDKLLELAQSIREHGILQPLVVTRVGNQYELIAGERRLQAAKMVGLAEVPVVVRQAEEQQKFEYAIIENIQRHDLNPIEESRAYDRLSKEFNLSQEDIAKKMGRSRSAIANTMRLIQLPVEIQRAVASGKISEGHAKALLSIEQPEKQRALFDLIVRNDLTVREAETKSRELSEKPPRKTLSKDPETESRERTLSELFGTKVRIAKTRSGGSIRIDYFSDEEFGSIFSKLVQEKREQSLGTNRGE